MTRDGSEEKKNSQDQIQKRKEQIVLWFRDWFIPDDEGVSSLVGCLCQITVDIKFSKKILPAAWEKAVDILIDDLPDVIGRAYAADVELGHTGPESYSAALAEMLLAAREVRKIAVISAISKNQEWLDYAIKILRIVVQMAIDVTGQPPSISHREAKAILIIQNALAVCGHNVSAETIVKAFKRKRIMLQVSNSDGAKKRGQKAAKLP